MTRSVRTALSPEGIAVLQLNGRGVNQVVMHYHMHLVPRTAGDSDLPITGWEIKPGDMDAIKITGEKIASAI